ncbi:MAG: metallophosphoesterase [Spirochaetes bacterium]|nr:metallophosphoesterase [Spirochaetota bacterium]
MINRLFKRTNTAIIFSIIAVLVLSVSSCWGPETPTWSFGVMADTQWTAGAWAEDYSHFNYNDDEGANPNSVSVSIINKLNQEFINKGVKFVVQVGDLSDGGSDEAIATRAAAAQDLYDAGIGFYAMRGNHESYAPIMYGVYNDEGIPAMQANFVQNQGVGDKLFDAYDFSSPGSDEEGLENMATELNGVSYSFNYGYGDNSATFVIFDPWPTVSRQEPLVEFEYGGTGSGRWVTYYYGYFVGQQQEWISSRLNKCTRDTTHAFVFSHQPLLAANHFDSPFGFLDEFTDDQNAFYSSLVNNNVAYYISGHDHIHHRDVVKSPDGLSEVEQVIGAPACNKFYNSDHTDENWHGQKVRQTTISCEDNNIGYYIYTVNGDRVTVDYYSDVNGGFQSGNKWPDGSGSLDVPDFNFVKKESWTFDLNGKRFSVAQGESYTCVQDSFKSTKARILDGTNQSSAMDDIGEKALVKRVNLGWLDKEYNLDSNILTLDGMADFGSATTDTYVLSMKADKKIKNWKYYRLVAKNSYGFWVNAVDLNEGGSKVFVKGSYKPEYTLGTYGVDKATNTVWAVINHNGSFAVQDKF